MIKHVLFALLASGCGGAVLRPLVPTDAARDLEQVTHSANDERAPSVSPDGKALAFEAGGSHVDVVSLADPGRVIYASKRGREPAWMPDASSIVYVRGGHVVQTFGQGERRVFNADVGDPFVAASQPAVSPDGKLVAVSIADVSASGRAFDRAIGVTDLLGTGVKLLTTGAEPAYSPDGKQIAFTRATGGRLHVFIANADGSNATQITEGPSDDHSPTFSPNGDAIAFCSIVRDGALDEEANLFVVKRDGSGLVQLTEGDRHACRPSWGRDGYIYFEANARHHFHIWRVRPN